MEGEYEMIDPVRAAGIGMLGELAHVERAKRHRLLKAPSVPLGMDDITMKADSASVSCRRGGFQTRPFPVS